MSVKQNTAVRRPLGTPSEVSEYLGIPEKTLTQWRYLGTGPKYSRIGKHVRYRWSDVDRWIDTQTFGGSAA